MPGGGIRDFLDLMGQTVTIEPFTGRDGYGVPTYGPEVAYRARVVGRVRLVRNAQGQDVASMHTVYLAASPVIAPEDRLTLPDEYVPRTPPILAVSRVPDERGIHHVVVYA